MSYPQKRTPIILVIILVLIVVFFFVFGKNTKEPLPVTVSLKWVNQTQFAGMFMAKEKGFYERSGLDVTFNEFEFGDSPMQDLLNGSSEFALTNANEFLITYDKNPSILAIAAIYQTSPFVVVSLKGQGITSPRDLAGKNLGIKGGTGAEGEIIYEILLRSAGLSGEDVHFKNMPLETTEREDLLSEQVDAIGLYRTRLEQLFDNESVPYDVIYPERHGIGLYNDILVTTKKFAQENPKIVHSFVHQTLHGWRYAFSHHEEAINTTYDKYVTLESYRDLDYLSYIFNESEKLIWPVHKGKIGAMESDRWQRFYDLLFEKGIITKDFSVEDSFTTKFLK